MPLTNYSKRNVSFFLIVGLFIFTMSSRGAGSITQGARINSAGTAITTQASEIDDSQFLVIEHYRDFLNREPDPAGLQFWTANIESCGSNAQCREVKQINTSAAFFLSIEFQETGFLVYQMYKAAFSNLPGAPVPIKLASFLPDTQAIGRGVVVNQGDWRTQLENNKNSFALSFVQRIAFQSAYPPSMSASDFVNKLDQNAGAVLSLSEKGALVSALSSQPGDAAKRAAALRSVAENQAFRQREFSRIFVLMQYFGYLQRDPNATPEPTLDFQGYNFWLNKLNQFNGDFVRAEMVKSFLTSQEYRARFIAPQTVTGVVAPSGGKIEKAGFASVTFPAGSFSSNNTVILAGTHTSETQSDFQVTSEIFSSGLRLPFEVRINSGVAAPATSFDAVIQVPDNFLKSMPIDAEIKVFSQIYENGGEEVLDNFEMFESTFDAVQRTVKVTLPKEAFTGQRTADGSFEAIVIVGVTPTKPNPTSVNLDPEFLGFPSVQDIQTPSSKLTSELTISQASDPCQGSSLGSPLEGTLTVTGNFNPPGHQGVDFRANGDRVLAMADGVIQTVGFNEKPIPRPDPRSGKMVKGWGRYVLIKHTDGSETLYAHLVPDSVTPAQVGRAVKKGDVIATSDNSGGSSGPHLHVEYSPNGQLFQNKKGKVNPQPCIGSNVSGSITVRDNGTLADDAFRVSLDGIILGTTAIGASNTFAANNLRPGAHTLTILCTIAPDDVGTYEVTLLQGLTFSGGGTSRSGTLLQGGTVSFTINVPSN